MKIHTDLFADLSQRVYLFGNDLGNLSIRERHFGAPEILAVREARVSTDRDVVFQSEFARDGKMRRKDIPDHRITSGGLMVSHEDDHLPVGEQLNGTKGCGSGNQFFWVKEMHRFTFQSKSHSVRVRGQPEHFSLERPFADRR